MAEILPGTSQHFLLKNRIKALRISQSLLAGVSGTEPYKTEELSEALRPVSSIISKCRTAQRKYAADSVQYRRFQKTIQAMETAESLIAGELEKQRHTSSPSDFPAHGPRYSAHLPQWKIGGIQMTSMEKRDILVKETIAPLLKSVGFKKSGRTWWIQREDCILILYMKNSHYNNRETGVCFTFQISASAKEEICGKISELWIQNQITCIEEAYFLPQCGFLHPYRNGLSGYQIDGKRNYQPLDIPVETLAEQIRLDFEDYILPNLLPVQTLTEWEALKARLISRLDEKEIRLLRYFNIAHMLSCSEYNRPVLKGHQKDLELSDQDIYDHIDLARIIAEHSCLPELDSKTYILESMAEKS